MAPTDHSDPSMPPPPSGEHGAGAPASHGAGAYAGEAAIHSVDVTEYGAERDGVRQQMDRRLFMQLLVYRTTGEKSPNKALKHAGKMLGDEGVGSVLYEDLSDPRSFAVLTWSENPAHFVERVRPVLGHKDLADLELRSDFTMTGRTYSSGHEPDLEYWLLRRPVETALNKDWPWAIWYPLRRGGAFEMLDGREQGRILKEHGILGRAYGAKDLAHDIRLACQGLDTHDNDFVIGLIG
ncbi:MAG: hypothetical protein KC417_08155, partial [Myxococcales bacterium]|nr:hypothetical protein [Myxococcales bacterium]